MSEAKRIPQVGETWSGHKFVRNAPARPCATAGHSDGPRLVAERDAHDPNDVGYCVTCVAECWHLEPAAPSRERDEGPRFPPQAGDVFLWARREEVTFTGRTSESLGAAGETLYVATQSDGREIRATGDADEFAKWFAFVRRGPATPPVVEGKREEAGPLAFLPCDYDGCKTPARPGQYCGGDTCITPRTPTTERGPGISALSLPPARQPYVCAVSDEDCLGVDV